VSPVSFYYERIDMANTIPTKITDKNGKNTTVHKKPESKEAASRALPTQVPTEKKQLSGAEADKAIRALEYVNHKHPDRPAYDAAVREIGEAWDNHLRSEISFASYSKEAHDKLFGYAYEEGHSEGRNRTEEVYAEISEIAVTALESKKPAAAYTSSEMMTGEEAREADNEASRGEPRERLHKQAENRQKFYNHLKATSSYSIPEDADDLIVEKAWEDGHSSGYQEVEGIYNELSRTIGEFLSAERDNS
jgi:hypothetical protein